MDVCREGGTALSIEGWPQPTAREWVECRLTIGGATRPGQLPTRLLDLVTNGLDNDLFQDFFFMSKPPGLRIRFHAGPAGIRQLTERLRRDMARLQHDALIDAWHFAVYEPETHLFGGKSAMTGVHRLFTADSIAWLRHHASSTSSTSPWIVSLNMLHALFEAMGITGWEDLEVWEHCRRSANRRLASPPSDAFTTSATKIAALWSHPDRLESLLDIPTRQLLADFAQSVGEVCGQWIPDYFHAEHALIGPLRSRGVPHRLPLEPRWFGVRPANTHHRSPSRSLPTCKELAAAPIDGKLLRFLPLARDTAGQRPKRRKPKSFLSMVSGVHRQVAVRCEWRVGYSSGRPRKDGLCLQLFAAADVLAC
ncbi:thiopeptide-type bacteriocin biosynthesis protein [Streptomyces sp. WMMC940]|nr:thiopeptide-type bacteriocin biosynthesis protein [Streptomyces sp. WMMC940]MCZ7459179.1 thiopeptide-type bacteriocin biosynthesis protein [Streptomyces sp. WMMC940]